MKTPSWVGFFVIETFTKKKKKKLAFSEYLPSYVLWMTYLI